MLSQVARHKDKLIDILIKASITLITEIISIFAFPLFGLVSAAIYILIQIAYWNNTKLTFFEQINQLFFPVLYYFLICTFILLTTFVVMTIKKIQISRKLMAYLQFTVVIFSGFSVISIFSSANDIVKVSQLRHKTYASDNLKKAEQTLEEITELYDSAQFISSDLLNMKETIVSLREFLSSRMRKDDWTRINRKLDDEYLNRIKVREHTFSTISKDGMKSNLAMKLLTFSESINDYYYEYDQINKIDIDEHMKANQDFYTKIINIRLFSFFLIGYAAALNLFKIACDATGLQQPINASQKLTPKEQKV